MKKSVSNPWNFAAPDYDHRSSNAVNAGTHYGVGKVQPVGHEGNPKMDVSCLPRGKMKTMRDDEKG
jgi:hypothetical protein